jgi:hypothetical protein
MSHFLRHLVQRSLAPATASVQPRLASRFESGAAPMRFTAQHFESAAETSPTPPARFRPTTSPTPPAAPRVEIAPTPAPPATTVFPTTAPGIATVTPSFPSTVNLTREISISTLPTATNISSASLPSPPAFTSITAAMSSSHPHLATPASPSTLLVERVTDRLGEVSPTAPTIARMPSSASPVTPPAAAPSLATSSLFSPTTAPQIAAAVVSAAAPTVRVSIGRIDIRAIHPPSPTAARAPAPSRPPLVSLESYLKRDAK